MIDFKSKLDNANRGRALLAFINTFKAGNIKKRDVTEQMCIDLICQSKTLEVFELRIRLLFKDSITDEQWEAFGTWWSTGGQVEVEEDVMKPIMEKEKLDTSKPADKTGEDFYAWMREQKGNIALCTPTLQWCRDTMHSVFGSIDVFISAIKDKNAETWWVNLTEDDYDRFVSWFTGIPMSMGVEGDMFNLDKDNFPTNIPSPKKQTIILPAKADAPKQGKPAMLYATPSERVPFDLTIKPYIHKVQRISPREPADITMLNPEQLGAFDKTMDVLCGEDVDGNSHILITGVAGAGKTFLIQKIIHHILHKNPGVKIACTAPTHRAVKVNRAMSPFTNNQKDYDYDKKNEEQFQRNDVTFITAHSLLELVPQMNESTNWVEVFSPNPKVVHGEEKIRQFDIVVMDEISMAGGGENGLLTHTMKWAGEVMFIFVGDSSQLEPVETPGVQSPIFVQSFRKKNGVAHAALKTVMRQALDSPILSLATTVREGLQYRRQTQHTPQGELVFAPANISASVPLRDRARVAAENLELEELIWTLFGSQYFDEDSDFARILTYNTREDVSGNVHWWNDKVRRILHQRRHGVTDLKRIELGDKLVLNAPCMDYDDEGNKVIKFSNMTELAVESFYESTQVLQSPAGLPVTWKCYMVKVRYQDVNTGVDGIDEIRVLHEDEIKKYDAFLKQWQEFALTLYRAKDKGTRDAYRRYYDLKSHFAGVEYNFALTVHRSQGGSFQYVLVHENNIRQMLHKGADQAAQYKPVMYVAVSRARYGLIMMGKGEE